MTRHFPLSVLALLGASVPDVVSAAAQSAAESRLPRSSVSILVEPKLNDGRLVIRLAAKNLGGSPVPFGPSSIIITKPSGAMVPIYPLARLVDDVRLAAGMSPEGVPATAPTQGAYSAPQQTVRDGGQVDVTGFTGGSTIGRDEYVRRTRPSRRAKPTISEAEAAQQIALLNQAILKDTTFAPGQVAAGQVVSEKLEFGKKEERTLHVRVRLAGDEHPFTIAAPKE